MLGTRFSLIQASLFGSPKEIKFAVLCSLALWFVADLSVQNVLQTACPVLICEGGFTLEALQGVHKNREVRVERDLRDKSSQLPHFLV